ncbi:hypothetical protein [Paenibacillus apiarius]|uniref:hypothetical protein n=1 Tax=Paenibacillus apiarius TaxID=46240 RepID=UPI003B3B539E
MDYNKLIQDLRDANSAAKAAADRVDDGGSSNLDGVFLRIPKARESKVLEAIKEAGLYCRCKRRWIGDGYMLQPDSGGGQARKREKAATVFMRELEARGWDVITFRKAD